MLITPHIQDLPSEVFDHIIEHVIITLGIYRAVPLRRVSKTFDAAILHAICKRRIIDVQHKATPTLLERLSPEFRARIFLQPSRSIECEIHIYVSVVATTNEALDVYFHHESEKARFQRHQLVAQNICFPHFGLVTDVDDATFKMSLNYIRQQQQKANGYSTPWMRQSMLEDPVTQAQNLLSAAALCGDLIVVKDVFTSADPALLSNNRSWTPFYHRPLILAAAAGHFEVVEYLLENGACLERDEEAELTILHGHTRIRIRTREEKFGPWHLADPAPKWRSSEWIDWADIAELPRHPLSAATRNGHTNIVHLLLKNEYRLPLDDTMYLKAMLGGAMAGRLDLVELLLHTVGRSLNDIRGLGQMLLHYAVVAGQIDSVNRLEKWGLDRNACLHRDTDLCSGSFLINPDSRFGSFAYPLMIAASKGDLEMTKFLMSKTPDQSFMETPKYERPVELAAKHGHEEVMRLLLNYGADPGMAFVAASSSGQMHLMRYLLETYPDLIDPDIQASKTAPNGRIIGQLALKRATKACHLAAMTYLVQAGASPDHGATPAMTRRNFPTGTRPMQIAKDTGKQFVVDHLVSLGARENVLDREKKLLDYESYCRFNAVVPFPDTWEWMSK
ncbi:ankyrin [Dissoconium aciculare CBS 342.82]|uniref:Ankyrin n=1 Tax=Dissoconium aciculare CBS 342.82 TaxID=1314786 RepID=A0A6J3LQV6_9PEZI|nr:ankyrin [Dissoconium aciculare CBS 342.82]KAF1818251.1 ankyrin [Dissoconium aciculare CBS 342.82]